MSSIPRSSLGSWILLSAVLLAAGGPPTGCTTDARPVQQLLDLQRLEREAHLTYDLSRLTPHLADTLVTVADGDVHVQARDVVRRRLATYLDEVTFLEWSDVEAPAVEVASSGDLATVRVHRRVRLGAVDSAGRAEIEHTVFSWWETWRKDEGRWRLAGMATTDRPGTEEVAEAERRATLEPAGRSPGEILERARDALTTDSATTVDSLRSLAFTAPGHSPRGAFRTSVRSDRNGRISLRQTTSRGREIRRSVGSRAAGTPDSAAAVRAFLQGHALLHLAVDPAVILGPPRRAGRLRFAGEVRDVVEFEDAAGHPLELAYDRRSGRLVGARIRPAEDPAAVILLYLSGWRSADGLRLPRRAVFLQGDAVFLYRLEHVVPAW